MKKQLSIREYIFIASMLFGLFFGAGNLIFPVTLGQQSGSSLWPAVIGFCLTGVGLPLLGIASMAISKSAGLFSMSSKVSKGFGYFFTCTLFLCIGPLFAIPRTATVSFQIGIDPFINQEYSNESLLAFSTLFFCIVLFFSLKPSGILIWVGKILNPIFLFFLGSLLITALIFPMGSYETFAPENTYASGSFFAGFIDGYNTMDALASLAFGLILIDVIRKQGIDDPKAISLCTIKAGCLSIALMALIYCSLALVGAQSRAVFGLLPDGGSILHAIAVHYYGNFGGIILGITITFACLKTSVGLVTSCSSTFNTLFPSSARYTIYAIVFTLFSFVISNVGLTAIIKYSIPALVFLYPLTIVLIFTCLVGGVFNYHSSVFIPTMFVTCIFAFIDCIHALPSVILKNIQILEIIGSLRDKLPLSSLDMDWIIPSVCTFALSLLVYMCRKNKLLKAKE